MQAAEVIKIPLSCIVASVATVVHVFGVKSQFELFADFYGIVAEGRLEAPIPSLASGLAISNSSRYFVSIFCTVCTWPFIQVVWVTPIRTYGIRNALRI